MRFALTHGSAIFALALLARPLSAKADIIEIGPADDLVATVGTLLPGDELVLAGGTYNLTQRFSINVSGESAMPIVIRAKDGEVPIITRPDAGENTINIEDATYVELRGIEVVGGSHGIRISASSFITIEGCHVHDTGDVGISANVNGSDYEGLQLISNHIHDTNNTGEGMYLGCNSNACQMHDSLIAGNYIHHTNGPTIEQGDGIEVKEGSYANIIRDNVIHDTNYPCIISYSTVGNGAPNVIERNAMWGCGDHGIQSAADVVIRNNIILSAASDGIRNQPHQAGDPSNIVIAHNTVIKAAGDAIRSDGIVGEVTIANNAIYAQSGNAIRVAGDLGAVTITGNVGIGSLDGAGAGFDPGGNITSDFIGASFSGAPPNDVFPAVGSLLVGAANATQLVSDDFNGTPRAGALDAGAYKFDPAGNPGWTLTPGPKSDVPAGEGGSGEGGAAAQGGGSSQGGAGSGNADAGGNGEGGGDGEGSEDGCSCRTADTSRDGGGWLALLALGALARGRRGAPRRR